MVPEGWLWWWWSDRYNTYVVDDLRVLNPQIKKEHHFETQHKIEMKYRWVYVVLVLLGALMLGCCWLLLVD